MHKYIDMVLVKHEEIGKPYLFIAPAFSHLNRGENVICSTEKGDQTGIVISCITVDELGDEFKFIRQMNGMRSLKRIKAKITINEMVYEEEKDGTDHDGE